MEAPPPIRTKVRWTEEHMRGSFADMTDTYATEACEGFVALQFSNHSTVVFVTQRTMAGYTCVKNFDELEFDMDDPVTQFILASQFKCQYCGKLPSTHETGRPCCKNGWR